MGHIAEKEANYKVKQSSDEQLKCLFNKLYSENCAS